MSTLAAVAPELVAEVGAALMERGRDELVAQLEAGVIERCTYDATVDAGYIYLVRPRPSPHFAKLAAPVLETIPFLEMGFNVDIDHDDHILGIELLSRGDSFTKLRHAGAL